MLENWLSTADLFDRFLTDSAGIEVVAPGLRSYGGRSHYCGEVATVACRGDGTLRLQDVLAEPGHGRVPVADVGAEPRWAVLGDRLGALAVDNGWAGVLLNGYVRDSACLSTLDLGVHALGTIPSRPREFSPGRRDLTLRFGNAQFAPGSWLYADQDGVVVCRDRQFPALPAGSDCTA